MSVPSALPAPVRVDVIELDGGVEGFAGLADRRDYDTAWVVGFSSGVPRGIVEVDLTPGAPPFELQLDSLVQLAATSRSLPLPDPHLDTLPAISVVVPSVIARLDELELCLSGLEQLDYPCFEIILVDNRRVVPVPDPLDALVERHPRVKVVREPRPGISAARNAGVAAANGEVVAFTDDDVHVDRRWLLALGQRFLRHPELDAVTGLILPAELETPAQIWFERYYGGFSGERTFAPLTLTAPRGRLLPGTRVSVTDVDDREVRTFAIYGAGAYGAGANMAFRRAVLQREGGGFDVALGTGTPARGGEDLAALIGVLWSGGRVGYEPGAVVHHKHRREYGELLHQLDGNGLGFTAMLTSLMTRDRRHVLGLASQLPLAARRMAAQSVSRLRRGEGRDEPAGAALTTAYPRALVLHELRGMTKGPLAYVRSRRSARAWRPNL